MTRRPTRAALVFPLLATIERKGGRSRPDEIYDEIADAAGVDRAERNAHATYAGKTSRLWDRHVRGARQIAADRGWLVAPERGVWELTGKGRHALRLARPGVVLTIFETDRGRALWATAEAAAGTIDAGSVDLILTSPPYPILTPRPYGGVDAAQWVDWMAGLAQIWRKLLTPGGSIMVNMGYTYLRGGPHQSLYPEEFAVRMATGCGWRLCQRLFWHNPHALPSPMPWVAIERKRVKDAVQPIYWFSRGVDRADNRRVLVPYSKVTLKKEIGRSREPVCRDSGYDFGAESFSRDNGGAIPPNLVIASNAGSQARHKRRARAAGLPVHPASFPESLAAFAIALATEPGDTVYDPFAGSGTVAAAAERLQRRWIASERAYEYLAGAALRLDGMPGFRRAGA